jgi:BlaI family penicillinase repressor
MNVVWKLEKATGREILAALELELAQTTLLTYLARLEAKGYVKREPSDRGYLYGPAVPRASVAGKLLDQVLTQFEGRLSSLVSHFVKTRDLSEDERQRLRQLLDQIEE